MTDQEFDKLKDDIEDLMDRLEELQQIHIAETGRRFVHPLRLAPRKWDSRICMHIRCVFASKCDSICDWAKECNE